LRIIKRVRKSIMDRIGIGTRENAKD